MARRKMTSDLILEEYVIWRASILILNSIAYAKAYDMLLQWLL